MIAGANSHVQHRPGVPQDAAVADQEQRPHAGHLAHVVTAEAQQQTHQPVLVARPKDVTGHEHHGLGTKESSVVAPLQDWSW